MALVQSQSYQEMIKKQSAEIMGAQPYSPPSPFDRLNGAVDQLIGVSKLAADLADKLVGSEKTDSSGGVVPLPPCDGLIGSLDQKTNAIREITESIEASLRRIDRRI